MLFLLISHFFRFEAMSLLFVAGISKMLNYFVFHDCIL